MTKKQVMISIDIDIHKLCKNRGIMVSAVCERALTQIVHKRTKKDAPEDSLELKCSICKNIVTEGYLCELRNRFVCNKCHEFFRCDPYTEHMHLKLPGFDNINIDAAKRLNGK